MPAYTYRAFVTIDGARDEQEARRCAQDLLDDVAAEWGGLRLELEPDCVPDVVEEVAA